MADLFGSNRTNNQNPKAYALRISASVQGTPIPIGCGQCRWPPILIDYDGFTAKAVSSGGGKGGGSSTQSYKYTCSAITLLGEGVIDRVCTIFNGSKVDFLVSPTQQTLNDLKAMGILSKDITEGNKTYNTIFHDGDYSQAADSWWFANFPDHSLAYRGLSYIVWPELALGSSPTFPAFTVEATWSISSDIPSLGPDANPADWIEAFLTNPDWGVQGFPSAAIGDFDTARTYWRATGMLISLVLTSAVAANSHLQSLLEALNCGIRTSGTKYDLVPYGDVPVSASYAATGFAAEITDWIGIPFIAASLYSSLGALIFKNAQPWGPSSVTYSYTPDVTPVYDLGPDDFLPNQGSLGQGSSSGKSFISFAATNPLDVFNKLQTKYYDRANIYNPVTIYETDDASITTQGRTRSSDIKDNTFFSLATAARMSARLQMQRLLTKTRQWQVTVGRQFVLLDALDLVSLTEPSFQLDRQLCRITEIAENGDSTLTLTLEEVPLTASAPVYNTQASVGSNRVSNAPPGDVNPPIFAELPDILAGGLVVTIGLSGKTPANFGGCEVFVSADGVSYSKAPNSPFEGATRMGVLTASLASVATSPTGTTIDDVNTLAVDLSESGGELTSVSPSAFATNATISIVDAEVLAYETATLVSGDLYDLTTLSRGAYGTAIAAHASGASFMRLDGSAFSWGFTADQIGKTIYFKFCAFNQDGAATQNIADVGAYPYVIQGSALFSPLPNVAGLYANYEAGFQKVYWDEITDFRYPISYEIRQGASWDGGLPIRTQLHPPFLAQGDGMFWVAAKYSAAGKTIYSAAPQSITIAGSQLSINDLQTYDEQANGWPGALDAGLVRDGSGAIKVSLVGGAVPINTDFYYTSAQIIDAGYAVDASIKVTALIAGVPADQNILTSPDILSTPDILGSTSTAYVSGWVEIALAVAESDIFTPPDVFDMPDAFAALNWGPWQTFVPGVYHSQGFKLRLGLSSVDGAAVPYALSFNWSVQIPARIDHYLGQSVPLAGLPLVFQLDGSSTPAPFNGGPGSGGFPLSVQVDWAMQAAVDYTITAASLTGMTIQFFDASSNPVAATGVSIIVEGY